MYLSHYNLSKIPFSISPGPNALWLGEVHSEALATLKYGIYENKGFVVLTGDIGTGKTALINRLVRECDGPALIATIPDPGLNSIDFFNFLADEFKLNGKFNTKGDFLILFKNFLHQAYASDKEVLLIIDEAQRLNHDLLEQIRLLSNIEMNDRKLFSIFFVGQSEFNKMLIMEQNKATQQRIAARYHLKPLTEKETAQYIQYRLKIVGATREIFQPKAIQEVFYLSGGYPRLINILCDRCLLTGYSMELQLINTSIVKECAKELQMLFGRKEQQNKKQAFSQKEEKEEPKKTHQSRFRRIKVATILLIAFAWGVVGYSFYKSKIGNSKYSEYIFSPFVKSDYTVNEREEFFTHENFANDTTIVDQNNYVWNERKEYIKHSKALIYFNHDSNEIHSQSLQVLDKLSNLILQHPDSNITIEGYTDSDGNYWYNKKLSRTRAEIVKSYFVEKGISPLKIEAVGRGSENPIANNETAVGRKKNRRVEIRISIN
jgi:general secretion pathway protein A